MKLGATILICLFAVLAGTANAKIVAGSPNLPKLPSQPVCDTNSPHPSCAVTTVPSFPTLPTLPDTGPGTAKKLCDWMPNHPSCATPIIVDPIKVEPLPLPGLPTYEPLYCSMTNDADVIREFAQEIKNQTYYSLRQSLLSYLNSDLPDAMKCLDGILLANSCQREKSYGSLIATSCYKLGNYLGEYSKEKKPIDYVNACMDTLKSAAESNELNVFGVALGKVVHRTHCSVGKISELFQANGIIQQPDCDGTRQCLGSNVSNIPLAVKTYRFPGNRGIQWNHQIKLIHEYNPMRWKYTPTSPVETVYDQPVADCTPDDLQNMYVTDRLNRKVPLSALSVYSHAEFPVTKAGWDIWDSNKTHVYENLPGTQILDFGPDVFVDVTPRDSAGMIMPFNVSSLDNFENRTLQTGTCKIQVVSVDSFPTDSSVTAINTEAARLEEDLTNKGRSYNTAKNYDNFVKAVEIPRLSAMARSLESTFNSLIDAAMSGDCETLPLPPLLPISGMVPFGPASLDTNCEDNGLPPSFFGLPINNWQALDLHALNVIFFDAATKSYKLSLSRDKTPWYFEAKFRQPRIKEALEKIPVEIAQIYTGIYFKQHPDQLEGFELPDVKKTENELRISIRSAKKFVDAFEAYEQLLGERLAEIRRKIQEREAELPK